MKQLAWEFGHRRFGRAFPWVAALSLLWCAALGAAGGCAAEPPVVPRLATGATAAAPAVGPAHPLPAAGPVEGVDNFGVVSDELWRGGKPTPAGMRALASLGVRTIIDLQEDDESADVPAGVRYVRLPASAWHADRVDVAAVLAAIAAGPAPVFIHCRQGRDRTGLAVAAYRLSRGASATDACRELREFHVNPWWQGPIERRVYALARSRPPG